MILNFFKKIMYGINNLYYLSFNILKLKYYNVLFDKSIKINGLLYIYSKGKVKLEKGVKINSCMRANPIGGDVKSIIIVQSGAKLNIGENTGISNSSIVCHNNIEIGKNTMIGGSCKIYDTDFHSLNAQVRISDNDNDIKTKPILIGDRVFIGAHTIVLKGSNIGDGSIIGAGSVVSTKIPPNEIWGGNPVRFISNIKIEAKK